MSKDKPSSKITKKVESLCEQGCSEINSLLKKAKKGKKLDSLSDFEEQEITQIVDELSQIMAIYDDTKQ